MTLRGLAICALIFGTWTVAALATYRPRRLCRCGRPEQDDGLGYAVCHEPEEDDAGPLSERPRALWAKGIGRTENVRRGSE